MPKKGPHICLMIIRWGEGDEERKEERFFLSPKFSWNEMERAKEESEAKKKDIDRLNKNKEPRGRILGAPKVAATYSPTICSTIGVAELNDPVRNGKGWDLSAITT